MTTTPALKKAKAVNYGPRDDNGCCWHCQHSETKHYLPSGTKFVCDVLNVQVLKGYGCNLFSYRRKKNDMEIRD